jgi:hypothetical protein
VISVGGPETGKTLGFLAPLASNMLDIGLYSDVSIVPKLYDTYLLYINSSLRKNYVRSASN